MLPRIAEEELRSRLARAGRPPTPPTAIPTSNTSPPFPRLSLALQRGFRHRPLPRVRAPALPLGDARSRRRHLRRAVHRHLLGRRRQGAQRAALLPRLRHQHPRDHSRVDRGALHGLRRGQALRRCVVRPCLRCYGFSPDRYFLLLRQTKISPCRVDPPRASP